MSALGHVTISCATAGCFAIITMHPAENARLRRSHETFYCPAGHPNYFATATEQEKRLATLERRISSYEDAERTLYRQRRYLEEALKTCPFGCGWQARRWTNDAYWHLAQRVKRDLADHLRECHGAEVSEREDVAA